jgi:hypothetical protein
LNQIHLLFPKLRKHCPQGVAQSAGDHALGSEGH